MATVGKSGKNRKQLLDTLISEPYQLDSLMQKMILGCNNLSKYINIGLNDIVII